MTILYDARGNEFNGTLDLIQGNTFTDARAASVNLGALNAETVTQLNGNAAATIDIRGTFVGTISFQGSIDGTNYIALPVINLLTETMATTTTTTGSFTIGCTGLRQIRVIMTAYTSGTAVVAVRASRADFAIYAKPIPSTAATVTAAANTAATLTLTAPGAGLYHYITSLHISRNATAALAGTATLVITTTNLPGSLAWSVGNAMAAGGTQIDIQMNFSSPLKSSVANTATTIVMPAPGAAVLWRCTATYYVGA
jgi:hypothetical protein